MAGRVLDHLTMVFVAAHSGPLGARHSCFTQVCPVNIEESVATPFLNGFFVAFPPWIHSAVKMQTNIQENLLEVPVQQAISF